MAFDLGLPGHVFPPAREPHGRRRPPHPRVLSPELQSDLGYRPPAAGAATAPMFALSSLCARVVSALPAAGPRLRPADRG
ncbi:hypothetical protein K376_00994 [Streptomyces sp. PsTaAH-130]|nr:hypothetical protein K376_00994 [Streptomyces sp. PsTaAH-130]